MTSAWSRPTPHSARRRVTIGALAAASLVACSTPRSTPVSDRPADSGPPIEADASAPTSDVPGTGGARPSDVGAPVIDAPSMPEAAPADLASSPPETAPPPTSPWKPAVKLSAGVSHTCALLVDGSIRCWGKNDVGQLGRPRSERPETRPVEVVGISGAKSIAVGDGHSCAITGDGAVWCWGWNVNGQLGNGTLVDSWRPSEMTRVRGVAGATNLATGAVHTCAVAAGLWCWGGFAPGGGDWTTPTAMPGLESASAVAIGAQHRCAVAGGGVRCWGANNYGQIGAGPATSQFPIDVPGIAGATALALGADHSCAIGAGGTARCWGSNFFGQLGAGEPTMISSPVAPNVPGSVMALSAGTRHTCALMTNGNVWCWGYNFSGELGIGTREAVPAPVQVGVSGATAIASGAGHTCVVVGGGSVWCWGSNYYGQLGTGAAGPSTVSATPVPVVTM